MYVKLFVFIAWKLKINCFMQYSSAVTSQSIVRLARYLTKSISGTSLKFNHYFKTLTPICSFWNIFFNTSNSCLYTGTVFKIKGNPLTGFLPHRIPPHGTSFTENSNVQYLLFVCKYKDGYSLNVLYS